VLAVELFEVLEVCLGVVHVVVFACLQEHRVVTHLATLLLAALVVLPLLSVTVDPSLTSTDPRNSPFLHYSLVPYAIVVSLQGGFHHPIAYFP
jgi:hypothetical protein